MTWIIWLFLCSLLSSIRNLWGTHGLIIAFVCLFSFILLLYLVSIVLEKQSKNHLKNIVQPWINAIKQRDQHDRKVLEKYNRMNEATLKEWQEEKYKL